MHQPENVPPSCLGLRRHGLGRRATRQRHGNRRKGLRGFRRQTDRVSGGRSMLTSQAHPTISAHAKSASLSRAKGAGSSISRIGVLHVVQQAGMVEQDRGQYARPLGRGVIAGEAGLRAARAGWRRAELLPAPSARLRRSGRAARCDIRSRAPGPGCAAPLLPAGRGKPPAAPGLVESTPSRSRSNSASDSGRAASSTAGSAAAPSRRTKRVRVLARRERGEAQACGPARAAAEPVSAALAAARRARLIAVEAEHGLRRETP